jgi:uncharacterized protein YndB with AHSA1/START domain
MSDTTSLTATREIQAPAPALFEILTTPARHREVDGSGFVRSDDHAEAITGTGETFRMHMTGDHMGGDYLTDNVVTGFEPDRMVSWRTGLAGSEPPGWEWVWRLRPETPERTVVSLTYDWGEVTDPGILSRISFPLVSREQLEDSLRRLAACVGAG